MILKEKSSHYILMNEAIERRYKKPQKVKPCFTGLYFLCREEGIRTPGTVSRTHAFQACSLNHSDTSL